MLEQFRQILEADLKKFYNELHLKSEQLNQPIAHILSLGGKRMRPLMAMISNQMFNGKLDDVLPAALAIEVFHNFTLVHDDIMDNAPLRRGKATVHEKWNNSVAILSGDAMMIKAYQFFEKMNPTHFVKIFPLFNQTALEVCEGQQLDMDFENKSKIHPNDYIEMIKLKTAVLLGCSMQIGAITANANNADAKRMYEFGLNLGIAFQLDDDILDVYAESEVFGKQVGGDILANKKTLLLLSLMEKVNETDNVLLQQLLSNNFAEGTDKVKEVTALYNKYFIREEATAVKNQYYQIALNQIKDLSIDAGHKKMLQSFAESIVNRTY